MSVQDIVLAMENGYTPTAQELRGLVDHFKAAERARLDASKIVDELKEKEVLAKKVLIIGLNALKIDAIGGADFVVQRTVVNEPTVEDWDKFYSYILKTKDFSLLERRPGKAAIKERWDDGKQVPGIAHYPVDKLSFTKVKV